MISFVFANLSTDLFSVDELISSEISKQNITFWYFWVTNLKISLGINWLDEIGVILKKNGNGYAILFILENLIGNFVLSNLLIASFINEWKRDRNFSIAKTDESKLLKLIVENSEALSRPSRLGNTGKRSRSSSNIKADINTIRKSQVFLYFI